MRTFLKTFIYFFLDRGEGREKERERNINVVGAFLAPPTGDPAQNPGMCPEWESNRKPFGLQTGTQSTEPRQPGCKLIFTFKVSFLQIAYSWVLIFLKDFIYLFLEKGGEGEREGEKHQCVVASCALPTGDLACNPGMCLD